MAQLLKLLLRSVVCEYSLVECAEENGSREDLPYREYISSDTTLVLLFTLVYISPMMFGFDILCFFTPIKRILTSEADM